MQSNLRIRFFLCYAGHMPDQGAIYCTFPDGPGAALGPGLLPEGLT